MNIKIAIKANLVLDVCIHAPMHEEIFLDNLAEGKIDEVCAAKSEEFGERLKSLICASRLFNPVED